MRMDRTLGSNFDAGSALKRIGGTSFRKTEISLARFGNRLPVRMKNGTPAQRQLSIQICSATNVSVRELGLTPGSSRYPGTRRPMSKPGRYWALTTQLESMARSD